jgi:hypothetical protein
MKKNKKDTVNINLAKSEHLCITIQLRNSKKVIDAYKEKLKD